MAGGLALNYLIHDSHHKSRTLATAAVAASVYETMSKNQSWRYNSSDNDSDGEQKKQRKGIVKGLSMYGFRTCKENVVKGASSPKCSTPYLLRLSSLLLACALLLLISA